ncbi:MAG: hypothetical protein ACRBEE_12140 [Arenicella sp.]
MSQNLQADTTSLDYRRFLLNYARERMAAKNFYDADFALQVSQSRYPNDPVSYNLHGMLAYRLGLYDHAMGFVKKALELDPSMERAQENLTTIERAYYAEKTKQAQLAPEERYFLIHSWGSGLGFDLLYLMQQLLIADLSDRKPIVYWGSNSLYNDDPNEDCFVKYFDPISDMTIDDLDQYMPDVYPAHWQKRDLRDYVRRTRWRNKINNQQYKVGGLYFLNRSEKVIVGGEYASVGMLRPWLANGHRYSGTLVGDIYRDLVRRYIRPKQYLQDRANQFIQHSFSGSAFIAIHIRGTDKHNEKQSNSIASINDDLIDRVRAVPGDLPVFLMTDDSRQLKNMRHIFGDRLHSIDVSRSSNEKQGVHHTGKDKRKITEEVLVDMLVASRSSHFFGCGLSYLACMVSYMQASKNSSTLLPFDVMTRFIDIPVDKS